ncbi:zinc finger CCCH domain-containing protein 39-like isoform X2 [Andrographis paniculata]|uniref:zinc finger CCCH domain-containing protein 39-like isoform X2 n=1 Tax=Andrographis paniculata TaxID=175694 RepID=UPI0021E71F18|nr:zinc finger CCCH domain-containing protein 39-like isoform X2 [Andrographis paniculata]
MDGREDSQFFRNHSNSRFGKRQFCFGHSDFDSVNPRMLHHHHSKPSIPYKSELCLRFLRGKCFHGESCRFAHSTAEIRKPELNPVDVKMKECYWFSSGLDCPYGQTCQFLHKCDRRITGGNHRNEKDQVECSGSLSGGGNADKTVSGKTKVCSKWERFGSCVYGGKCIFLHGKAGHKDLGCSSASKKLLRLKPKKIFLNWDTEKISEVYADWVWNRHANDPRRSSDSPRGTSKTPFRKAVGAPETSFLGYFGRSWIQSPGKSPPSIIYVQNPPSVRSRQSTERTNAFHKINN